jgi:hypothetical protein
MSRKAAVLSAGAFLSLAPLCQPAQPVSVKLEGATVVARDSAGMALWRVRPRDAGQVSIRALPNGTFDLGDGTLLSAQGRLLARGGGDHFSPAPETAPTDPAWSPLITIDPSVSYDPPPPPQFDSMGNAWLVTLDADSTTLTVIESNGVSGTWQTPQSIAGTGFELEGPPAMTIDSAGVVHVVCRNISSGQYQLVYSSHAPGGAWQAPQVIYSSPNFFENISLTTDSAGDVIVVFDPESESTGLPQGWSMVYSQATGMWGSAQMITPASQVFNLPSLARSPNGSLVLLVYTGSLGVGLYYQFFAAGSQTWQAGVPISGTSQAAFIAPGVGAKYPLVVDDLGNATLIVPYYSLPKGEDYKLEALRYENGSWTHRTTLVPWGPASRDGDVYDFGSIAQNGHGDVLAAAPAYTTTVQEVDAYRFTPGAGWNVETFAQQSHNFSISSVGVAWFESSGEAVASYLTPTGVETTMYIGGSWSYSPVVPGTVKRGDGLATASTGQVLMTSLRPSGHVLATFLRP